jgi:DNA ligase (NAD+)
MGDKSAQNLADGIRLSKSRPLAKVIFGLGILHVGGETAELLSGTFGSLQGLIDAQEDELQKIPGIGPKIAAAIIQHFHSASNRMIVQELETMGITAVLDSVSAADTPQPLAGKRFVLTGRLEQFTRSEAELRIKQLGGQISSDISRTTDYVVVGIEPGSKLQHAQELNIVVLEEMDLVKILDTQDDIHGS